MVVFAFAETMKQVEYVGNIPVDTISRRIVHVRNSQVLRNREGDLTSGNVA